MARTPIANPQRLSDGTEIWIRYERKTERRRIARIETHGATIPVPKCRRGNALRRWTNRIGRFIHRERSAGRPIPQWW